MAFVAPLPALSQARIQELDDDLDQDLDNTPAVRMPRKNRRPPARTSVQIPVKDMLQVSTPSLAIKPFVKKNGADRDPKQMFCAPAD
jgi:hypothetical protein